MSEKNTGWPVVLAFLNSRRRFLWFAASLLLMELAGAAVLPKILPDTWYLDVYLRWRSVTQTERFLNGELDVAPDPLLGWRNRSNAAYAGIRYDEHGSRSFGGISPDRRKRWRVLFFGDSRVNGYVYLNNDQTINAYLEDESVETLNLATAFYGLDQMYLAFRESVREYGPDVAVIGIGSETEKLLDGHYIPFILRKEYGMPFLKPRFELTDEGLLLRTPKVLEFLGKVPHSPEMLDFLAAHDGYYERFEYFKRWESTPILAGFSTAVRLFGQWWDGLTPAVATAGLFASLDEPERAALRNPALFRALIREIKSFAEASGVKVSLILFPSLYEFRGQEIGQYEAAAAAIRSEDIHFIDVRKLFKGYRGGERLYSDDTHVTPAANRLIAEVIRRSVLADQEETPTIVR